MTHFRVAVLGAAGGIGQPLSLLLKQCSLVSELSLYDIRGAPGVAADLSHIPSPAKVTGYDTADLHKALSGANLVIIPAGVPRKPGMTRDDLFNTNASIVSDLVTAVAETSPKAIIGIISNPVNSTVPIAAEVLKRKGVYDKNRLFGVTSLDRVRARTFVSEALRQRPDEIDVPVIGGHSGDTIVPLLSLYSALSQEQVAQLTHRIQFGGDEVVKAKAGAGSATLSMAYAGADWALSMLRAMRGDAGVIEYSFVDSDVHPGCSFFSSALQLGKDGITQRLPLPKLNAYEQGLLDKCVAELTNNIKKGIAFANK